VIIAKFATDCSLDDFLDEIANRFWMDQPQSEGFHDYRSLDTGAYRDVREIWERAELFAGEDKFKTELIRGLNALTGHLEYDIGQIKAALSGLSALSELTGSVQRKKRK
jgi:hypothetical protein